MTTGKTGTKGNRFIKDPNATLDYVVNWNSGSKPFLGTDTIATSTWIVPAGLTVQSSSNTTTTATIWLSGGVIGKYSLTNRITTAGGRIADKTIYLEVKEQ